ncbi:MAG: ABC transporter permease [Verrucomicrobia bacterium]|nr:ABC transporter permease [Verrucomicrobiota bacterium]
MRSLVLSALPALRLLARNRLAAVGATLLMLLAVLALLAPVLTRAGWVREPVRQDARGLDEDGMPRPPGDGHRLGTDNLGRDVLSRALHGSRVSLPIGIGAMVTATAIGLAVGLLAGFYGGRLDMALMRFTEINMTIPAILLAVAFAGLMDGRKVPLPAASAPWHWFDVELKRGMVSLFVVIGLVCWPGMVRVIRGQVLALRDREFIAASRSLGASDGRLILQHILPNLLPTVIVLAVMNTGNMILLEAGLGYLGIGVPPPAPTWGSMINDGQPYFVSAPHIVIVPGLAIVVTVLAFNLLGQGLQEVLDPKQRR